MKILSYYQCPSDCQSVCCKEMDITMDKQDLKILRKAPKTKTITLQRITHDDDFLYIMKSPCNFLSDTNKCTEYNRRPTKCRTYPFNYVASNSVFMLIPCNMGMNILADYGKYFTERYGFGLTQEQQDAFKKANELFNSDLDSLPTVPAEAIKLEDIKLFTEYLQSIHHEQ